MHRTTKRLSRAAVLFSVLSLAPVSGGASAAPGVDAVVGTWTLVLVDNVSPDGGRTHLYGPNPQGILTFDGEGRYALQIVRSERPKFASGDKSIGTAEENKAAVLGANAHFGRYAVDEARHTLTFKIDHASFPNWDGTEQTRSFTLKGDLLTYVVPVPTSGANVVGEDVWRRLR
jgi:hypothetical protein